MKRDSSGSSLSCESGSAGLKTMTDKTNVQRVTLTAVLLESWKTMEDLEMGQILRPRGPLKFWSSVFEDGPILLYETYDYHTYMARTDVE